MLRIDGLKNRRRRFGFQIELAAGAGVDAVNFGSKIKVMEPTPQR